MSQIARASTLQAEDKGAEVSVSPGKHASYLNEELCRGGCGADRCIDMVALPKGKIINLGEVGRPMNGAVFIASTEWPLTDKMSHSNFSAEAIARLNRLPDTDIAWFNAGGHPAQQIISVSGSTERAIAGSGVDTTSALATAGGSTDTAISVAGGSTGNALQKSYRHTKHALGVSIRQMGRALDLGKKADGAE